MVLSSSLPSTLLVWISYKLYNSLDHIAQGISITSLSTIFVMLTDFHIKRNSLALLSSLVSFFVLVNHMLVLVLR